VISHLRPCAYVAVTKSSWPSRRTSQHCPRGRAWSVTPVGLQQTASPHVQNLDESFPSNPERAWLMPAGRGGKPAFPVVARAPGAAMLLLLPQRGQGPESVGAHSRAEESPQVLGGEIVAPRPARLVNACRSWINCFKHEPPHGGWGVTTIWVRALPAQSARSGPPLVPDSRRSIPSRLIDRHGPGAGHGQNLLNPRSGRSSPLLCGTSTCCA